MPVLYLPFIVIFQACIGERKSGWPDGFSGSAADGMVFVFMVCTPLPSSRRGTKVVKVAPKKESEEETGKSKVTVKAATITIPEKPEKLQHRNSLRRR